MSSLPSNVGQGLAQITLGAGMVASGVNELMTNPLSISNAGGSAGSIMAGAYHMWKGESAVQETFASAVDVSKDLTRHIVSHYLGSIPE